MPFSKDLLTGASGNQGGGAFYEYQIEHSARFDRVNSSYLSYAVPSGSSSSANWTVSLWFKRGLLGIGEATFLGNSGGWMRARINSDDTFQAQTQTSFLSTFVLRDTGGWTNLIMNSQDTNNFKVYVNGVDRTSNLTKSSVAAMISFFYPSNTAYLGNDSGSNHEFDGHLAEVHMVYGLNKDADDFGETKNGVWVPKEYTGSYGTYGAYLKFENASALGNDSSGNDNDWTANNMGTDHQSIDTPTIGTG